MAPHFLVGLDDTSLIFVIPGLTRDPVSLKCFSYALFSELPMGRAFLVGHASAMPKQFAVYILSNRRNGALYVGVTSDLARRIDLHRSGAVPGFSKDHAIHRLVHVEYFDDAVEAIAREKRVKRWLRRWKIELIERGNPYWRDLSELI